MKDTYIKWRKLPHYHPPGADYFITYRLAGSIPKHILSIMQEEFESQIVSDKMKKGIFNRFDELLHDNLNEPYWLKEDLLAKIVADSLFYLNGSRFNLDSFCIMPNHVHVLFSHLEEGGSISSIMHDHKGFTASRCNKALGRTGTFWEKESYDHVVRNQVEFQQIRAYILNNPVKAGFVKQWQDWKWTYCADEK
jgi:REP element-mobilizing transposase RayT